MTQQGNSGDGTLNAIYGTNEVTLSSGEKIEVSKMKVRYVKPALDLIRKVVSGLLAEGAIVTKSDLLTGNKGELLGVNPSAILQLISNSYDEAFELVSYHVAMDKEVLLDLDLEDGLALVAGVIRVNIDFFIKRVLPLLLEMATSAEVLANNRNTTK